MLVVELDAEETRWTRLAWVFASVEAIAFGAAGALFGSSIQRQRAERAEEEAAEHRGAAANGRALAELIKADAPADGAGAAAPGGLASLGRPIAAAAACAGGRPPARRRRAEALPVSAPERA